MKMAGVLEYVDMSKISVDLFRGVVYCVWSVFKFVNMLCIVCGCCWNK